MLGYYLLKAIHIGDNYKQVDYNNDHIDVATSFRSLITVVDAVFVVVVIVVVDDEGDVVVDDVDGVDGVEADAVVVGAE